MLRRVLLASVGAMALAGPALAADLTRPPPPPVYVPPAPPPLWTGFYIGLNAGGTWSSNNTVDTSAFPGPCNPGFGGCSLAVAGPINSSFVSAALATFSTSQGSNGGFIGGGQVGYNYQFGPSWVAGVEADIQGVAGSTGSATFTRVLAEPVFPGNPFLETASVSRRVDYIGTLRGRLGWLATPTFLVYGTGGLAYGGVNATTNITQFIENVDSEASPNPFFSTGSLNNTRVGWTAGGGVEWMFLPNWSLKVEYLYYDLGSVTYALSPLTTFGTALSAVDGGVFSTAFAHSSVRFNGNIVRAGLNYHFNWAPAPVVAKY
jgi:outer membrane immunogenic protein